MSLSSFAIFCLARPAIFSAFSFLSQVKNTESLSFNLQIFIKLLIALSEKYFIIGPLPVSFPFLFSNVIYPSPFPPSSFDQLFS
jgi:hypothetical protein